MSAAIACLGAEIMTYAGKNRVRYVAGAIMLAFGLGFIPLILILSSYKYDFPYTDPHATVHIDGYIFMLTAMGARCICSAFDTACINLKNKCTSKISRINTVALFMFGWIVCAAMLGTHEWRMMVVVASIGISGSVIIIQMSVDAGEELHEMIPLIFCASWVVIGIAVGSHLHGWNKYAGLIASALMIRELLNGTTIPKLRMAHMAVAGVSDNDVDFGLPLYVGAWLILIVMNSIK